MAKIEDELDITLSGTKDNAEQLELVDKEAVATKLQAVALQQR